MAWKMKNHKIWQGGLVLCALVGRLSGCRTWMHSDKQPVTIFTTPPETAVVIDDYLHLTAPCVVTLSRKDNHLAQVNKDGFEPTLLKIDRTWSCWIVGNIFGCLVTFSPICIMNDIDQGGYDTFDAKVHITLDRKSSSESPPAR